MFVYHNENEFQKSNFEASQNMLLLNHKLQ